MQRLKSRSSQTKDGPLVADSVAMREAIVTSSSLDQLIERLLDAGMHFAGASGVAVSIGNDIHSVGKEFQVSAKALEQATKEKVEVAEGRASVVPMLSGNQVLGFVFHNGGNYAAVDIMVRAGADALIRLHAQSDRLASADASSIADVDGLTGVGNRRRLDDDLAKIRRESAADDLSLAVFDIDSFYFYNDAHGKQAGNKVLRSIADLIAKTLRDTDVVYRYGGTKFVALLPGASVDDAAIVVERVRQIIETAAFVGEEVQPSGRITMSIGVAAAPTGESGTLFAAAEIALAEAKQSGRNRVVTNEDGSDS